MSKNNDHQKARRNELYKTLPSDHPFWACVEVDDEMVNIMDLNEDHRYTTVAQRVALRIMDNPNVELVGAEGADRPFEMQITDTKWGRNNLRHRRVAVLVQATKTSRLSFVGKVIIHQTWNRPERMKSTAQVVGLQTDTKHEATELRRALGWRDHQVPNGRPLLPR